MTLGELELELEGQSRGAEAVPCWAAPRWPAGGGGGGGGCGGGGEDGEEADTCGSFGKKYTSTGP